MEYTVVKKIANEGSNKTTYEYHLEEGDVKKTVFSLRDDWSEGQRITYPFKATKKSKT